MFRGSIVFFIYDVYGNVAMHLDRSIHTHLLNVRVMPIKTLQLQSKELGFWPPTLQCIYLSSQEKLLMCTKF
jgi:hypothetical protein